MSISASDVEHEAVSEKTVEKINLIPQSAPLIYAALFLLALLVQFLVMRHEIDVYDESLELCGAERVLNGGIPYRDFWTMYGPAQFYVLAAFFKVFGVSVIVGRVYDALVKAGLACTCFALVRQLANKRFASVAFVASLLWMTCDCYPVYNFPVYPALLCALLSALVFSHYLAEPSNLHFIFAAGTLVGISAIFRHDCGFYACLSEVITILWVTLSQRQAHTSARKPLFDVRRPLISYLSGISIVALPVLLLLLWKVPVHDLFYDLFYFPAKVYPKVRSLPFPLLRDLPRVLHPLIPGNESLAEQWIIFFPVLVWFTTLASLLSSRRSVYPLFDNAVQRSTFILLFLLNAFLFLKGIVRVSTVHYMQCILVAIVLLLALQFRLSRLKKLCLLPLLGCGLLLVAFSAPLFYRGERIAQRNLAEIFQYSLRQLWWTPAGFERARFMHLDPESVAAIRYVQQHTSPGDQIYVGAGRHDKLFVGDMRFYFISGRSSITKWYELHPGLQTTLPIQQEIIQSMRRNPPKLVVLNYSWDGMSESNESSFSSGVTDLDDYIRSSYSPQGVAGSLVIYLPIEKSEQGLRASE